MNLPNKLTVLRILMIPVFLVFMLVQQIPHHFLYALIVFVAASLTDFMDGQIARRENLITDFGKLMDPLADKLLVMAAMVCFVYFKLSGPVTVILILSREFLVTSIRLLAAGDGKVIAADIWGKIKTVLQMVWVCYTILIVYLQDRMGLTTTPQIILGTIGAALEALVIALTVFSGFNYLWKNRQLLADR